MKTLAAYLLAASVALGASLQIPTARSGRSTALENLLRSPDAVLALHFEPIGRLTGEQGATVEISALKILNRVNQTSLAGARVVLNNQVQLFIDVTEFEALQGLLRDLPLYEKSAPAATGTEASVSRIVTRGGLFVDIDVDGGSPGMLTLSAERDDGSVVAVRLTTGAYEQLTTFIENAKTAAQRML